jgi:glutamine amidotransferase
MIPVGIIDYEAGNLASLLTALREQGASPEVLVNPAQLHDFERVILPGVGAFGHGMEKLTSKGWDVEIKNFIKNESGYFLGICLGMHLLGTSSEETPGVEGLGLLNSAVTKLKPKLSIEKVPHVGWNNLINIKPHPLLDKIPADADFYFVHSYGMRDEENEIAGCDYGQGFSSVVAISKNVFAAQFHPEKSSKHGSRFLSNFLRM